MSEHVIPVLGSKRAEISGHILDLEKRIARFRADLANIDAAIRILSSGTEPGAIPPKRAYKRTKYFAQRTRQDGAGRHAEGRRTALGAGNSIAIMKAKGIAIGDDRLCATVTDMLLVALRSLAKRKAITKTGVSRNAQWAICLWEMDDIVKVIEDWEAPNL